MPQLNRPLPSNKNYRVEITKRFTSWNGSKARTITASIPEVVSMATESQWESRLPANLGEALGVGAINQGLDQLNLSTSHKSLTQQTWVGTTPIEFMLELLFNAHADAKTEVVDQMVDLMTMSMPTVSSGLLYSPGPSYREPNRNRVSLRIGSYVYISSVLIVQVNNTFDSLMSKEGYPISGRSEVTFRTIDTPSADDMLVFFGRSAGTPYYTRD